MRKATKGSRAIYNKLFTKILDSTVWLEDDATRLVWITFLAVMDEDGFVALSATGNVAARARVSLEAAEAAIRTLEAPDTSDPAQDHDGRRIERVPYGWMVLNATKYRDLVARATARASTRERVRKHRLTQAGLEIGLPCAYCSEDSTGPDHIIPKSQGGLESVPACGRCNQRKASRVLADFLNDPFCNFLDHDSIRKNKTLAKYAFWDGESYQVVTQKKRVVTQSEAVSVADQKSTTFAPDASRRGPKVNGKRISFDPSKGAFQGITEEDELRWQDAYPAVPIPPAIAQAAAWLAANPANRKSNNERFLVNWFKREQDKAGRVRR